MDHAHVIVSTFQLVRIFTPYPQKTGGFWEGQLSAVPKFYGTRPPPLIQSCYSIESSRYCVKNIDLKFLMTGFLQRTNSDKNPQTETTKPFSACKLVASDKPQKNKDLVGFLLFGFFVSRVYGPKFPAFACLSHRSDIIHWHMSCAQETRGHGSIYRRGQLHIYIYRPGSIEPCLVLRRESVVCRQK